MSNVVSLVGVKKDRASSENTSDTRLIEQCMIYAQSVAAFAAGCKVESDDHDLLMDRPAIRARNALKKIAKTPRKLPQVFKQKRTSCRSSSTTAQVVSMRWTVNSLCHSRLT